ncbi:hypothetical protein, partial [Cupriavidus consociatus]|uniref:hypothetical protein n=1 Tax=Cupriavidus consociatus TaxID=2821357 RepID=UPI001AE120E3
LAASAHPAMISEAINYSTYLRDVVLVAVRPIAVPVFVHLHSETDGLGPFPQDCSVISKPERIIQDGK